jgi:membrane protease YdiL (CAAX protease family)
MTSQRRSLLSETIIVIGLVVAPPLLRALFAFLHPGLPMIRPEYADWSFAGSIVINLLLLALVLHLLRLRSESMDEFTEPFAAKDLARGLGLFVWASVSYFGTYLLVLKLSPGPARADEGPQGMGFLQVKFSFFYLLFILLNPFVEEGIVRGYLQTRLRQTGQHGAVVVLTSTVVQSSYHIYQGVPACLALFPGFLVYAAYYHQRRRWWPVLVAHLIEDVLAMLTLMR